MSASPLALTMESVARLLGYPCCSRCGLHGPHRTFAARDGGTVAVCLACQQAAEAQAAEYVAEESRDRLEAAHG